MAMESRFKLPAHKLSQYQPAIQTVDRTDDRPDALAQALPGESGFGAAETELSAQTLSDKALKETTEGMSLISGAGVRPEKTLGRLSGAQAFRAHRASRPSQASRSSRSKKALRRLASSQMSDDGFADLVEHFFKIEETAELSSELQNEGLSEGAMLLVLSELLSKPDLPPKKRKKASKLLDELTESDNWSLDVCAFIEVGLLDAKGLKQLKVLYQKSSQGRGEEPQGLAEWFEALRQWSDRRNRIRAILRALSLDLSVQIDGDTQIRVAATIADLQKLLLFLGLEDHTRYLTEALQLPADTVLTEVILCLEQHWVYPEWVQDRLERLPIESEQHPFYLNCLKEVIQLMPEACFRDNEQSQQIVDALALLNLQTSQAQSQQLIPLT